MNFTPEELLNDYEKYHSAFQIEHFIVGKQGNTFGRYRQALRELHGRHHNVRDMFLRIEELRLRIAGLERWRWLPWGRGLRRNRLARLRMELAEAEESMSHGKVEYEHFLEIARALKTELGGMPPARRRELEEDYWFARFRKMAAVSLMATGHVDPTLLDSILSLPPARRMRLLDEMHNPDTLWKSIVGEGNRALESDE